jgi:hypothetical protein
MLKLRLIRYKNRSHGHCANSVYYFNQMDHWSDVYHLLKVIGCQQSKSKILKL